MQSPIGQFVKSVPAKDLMPAESAPTVEVSPLVRQYVGMINKFVSGGRDGGPTVEVNESVGMLAFAYEKLRNSVEYREEHVLLRSAIKRILKRRLNPMWQYESIASALLRELIWARYIKNDSLPQSKEAEIEAKLRKYNVLRQSVRKYEKAEEWNDWILGIAACDIEQVLVERQASNALAEVMYQSISQHVRIDGLAETDKEIQLYVAVHRALLKSDATLISYHLFLLNAGGWAEASEKEAEWFATQLPHLRKVIEAQLHHPKAQDLTRIAKRLAPPYLVLDDVVKRNPELALGVLARPEQLRAQVEEVCKSRYGDMRQRVMRAIVRSMIYILITKMALAFLIEVPYDRYMLGEVHWGPLAFNVLFPPIFMAMLGLSIKTPGQRNTDMIFNKLSGVVTGELIPEQFTINKKRSAFAPIMGAIYWASSVGMFALVAWLLWRASFTIVGIGLFLFFFGVVVFFAYRVRQIAMELSVIREKENLFEGFLTLITLPFVRLGHRMSAEFGKMNVFAFILDVLLEAPFKLILDLTEHWINFVRQKREEMVEAQDY
jgi:ABC-type multidrug transport system fused ATPase/permease subunit